MPILQITVLVGNGLPDVVLMRRRIFAFSTRSHRPKFDQLVNLFVILCQSLPGWLMRIYSARGKPAPDSGLRQCGFGADIRTPSLMSNLHGLMRWRPCVERPSMTVLRLILGDQLNRQLASLRDINIETDIVLMAEVGAEVTYVKHHKRKIAFCLRQCGISPKRLGDGVFVIYRRLDDPENGGSLESEVNGPLPRIDFKISGK